MSHLAGSAVWVSELLHLYFRNCCNLRGECRLPAGHELFWVHSFKSIPFSVDFFLGMFILVTHSSENGRFGRSPKPSTTKNKRFSRLLRDLRAYSFKPAILLNSENGRLPKTQSLNSKECEFWKSESLGEELVSLDKICRRSHLPSSNSNSTKGLAKPTLTNFSKVLKSFCFWQWKVFKTFQTYRFQKSGLEKYVSWKRRLTKTELV